MREVYFIRFRDPSAHGRYVYLAHPDCLPSVVQGLAVDEVNPDTYFFGMSFATPYVDAADAAAAALLIGGWVEVVEGDAFRTWGKSA